MDDDAHREFLLAALRSASARVKVMELDINTIGVALKGDLIHPDMAVKWINECGLMWLIGPLPEQVGMIERTVEETHGA